MCDSYCVVLEEVADPRGVSARRGGRQAVQAS